MKTIRLSIDEKVFAAVQRHAAARSMSIHQLVRDYLGEIARREDRAAKARSSLRSLSERSAARIGGRSWTRENLHDR